MKLRKRQIKATWKSAEHWLQNWEDWNNNIRIRLGYEHCPLCQQFNHKNTIEKNKCRKCPVAIETNTLFCDNTPFEDVEEFLKLYYNTMDESTPEELEEYKIDIESLHNDCSISIEEQYKFLVNLALKISSVTSD